MEVRGMIEDNIPWYKIRHSTPRDVHITALHRAFHIMSIQFLLALFTKYIVSTTTLDNRNFTITKKRLSLRYEKVVVVESDNSSSSIEWYLLKEHCHLLENEVYILMRPFYGRFND